MAAAEVAIPSSQRCAPNSVNIPIATWPTTAQDRSVDAKRVSQQIIDSLNSLLAKEEYESVGSLFVEDGYWRDHLALTWDLRTLKGRQKMCSFLASGTYLRHIQIDYSDSDYAPQMSKLRADGSVEGILFFTVVTTEHGSGRGVTRLVEEDGQWKIWTMFTSLDELRGHEEKLGPNRDNGVQHGATKDRKNWAERRMEESNFEKTDPDVLIIGCGQAGLSVHARLKMLGVPTLTVDTNHEVGDNWRRRYHQLVLHDPVWYDHMPYVRFPDFWPVFTPKDKLADFLQSYARMLELDVWNRTTLESSEWEEEDKEEERGEGESGGGGGGGGGRWTVRLRREHGYGRVEERMLRPRHIVQATGHSGKKNYPSFKGMDSFRGDRLCHSSEFEGARKVDPEEGEEDEQEQQQQQQQQQKKKKAVVVGSCNSALDIAQDYHENGYDVTVVQRSSTAVMSSKTVLELLLGGLYREGGPATEDADLLAWSLPGEVFKAVNADVNEAQEAADRDMIEGLHRAGFATDRGPMNCGLWFKYLQRGGGYYIDVGTSQLIIDGRVRVRHGRGVDEILPRGLRLEGGEELEADEIVCATGYQNMRTATEMIFGADVAARVPAVWGFDDEGETRTIWRPSGHPGLWLHGGNLAMCRYFSRLVALQIKARLEGLSRAP